MKHKVLGGRRREEHVLVLNHGVQAVPKGSQIHELMFVGDAEALEDRNMSCTLCIGCWAQNKLHKNFLSRNYLEEKL